MEILVSIAIIIFASCLFLEKLTKFIKQLSHFKPKGLLGEGKRLNVNVSISSEEKKEACATNTNSKSD